MGQDYPRLANAYLHGSVDAAQFPQLAHWDVLILDSAWSQADLDQLRRLNPELRIFLYVCPYCTQVPPNPTDLWAEENYAYAAGNDLWWYNRNGFVASDWPGTRMVNITSLAPAGPSGPWRQYIAGQIETLMAEHPAADGVFLDNFWKGISWQQGVLQLDSDCNPTHNPAGCDGSMDTNAVLDSLWNQALRVLAQDLRQRFDALEAGRPRRLALFSNSSADYYDWLNGTLWEFFPEANGAVDPGNAYGYAWTQAMFEQGVGYLEAPFSADPYRNLVLNSVWGGTHEAPLRSEDFERHKRFTLVSTLLGDGFFSLDAGREVGHGCLWWEPEYDHAGRGKGYLGAPTSAPYRVAEPSGAEVIQNGSFSNGDTHWFTLTSGTSGNLEIDTATFRSAPAAARVDVIAKQQIDGDFKVWQSPVSVQANQAYTLRFWARASTPQRLLFHLYSEGCPGFRCLRDQNVQLDATWQEVTVSFVSPSTAVSGLNFFVSEVGQVWLDDVSLRAGDSNVFRRDFENGSVLLNYTQTSQRVDLGTTYTRLDIPGSTVFDGAVVTSESIPPSDARILLRFSEDPAPEPPPAAGRTQLHQNEPNPFNPTTRIRFTLGSRAPVELVVYSAVGRRVRLLVDAVMQDGIDHEVIWDGTDDFDRPVGSGVYFYRLDTPSYSDMRKMTLVR